MQVQDLNPTLGKQSRREIFIEYTLCAVFNYFSCIRLSVIPWTIAHQVPLSMGFCPWDSPGNNTGVGYHALLEYTLLYFVNFDTKECITFTKLKNKNEKKIFNDWKHNAAAAAAKSLQLCLTLCDPIDGSPPGSPVPGILQARTLEWVALSFSNAWKWKVKVLEGGVVVAWLKKAKVQTRLQLPSILLQNIPTILCGAKKLYL